MMGCDMHSGTIGNSAEITREAVVALAALVVLVLTAPGTHDASAQSVIDASDLDHLTSNSVTTTIRAVDMQSFPGLQVIYAQTGGNQVFDFTTLTFRSPTTVSSAVLSSPAGTPAEGDPFFAAANRVTVKDLTGAEGQSWAYWRLTAGEYASFGTIVITDTDSDGVADTVITRNDPADISIRFPLQFNDSWSEAFTQTVIAGAASEMSKDHQAVVDGWGVLKTPSGDADVLRLKETQSTTIDLGGGTFVRSTFELVSFLSEGVLSATILVDESGAIVGGAYSVLDGVAADFDEPVVPASVRLGSPYPNPFTHETAIPLEVDESSFVDLRVFDVAGREVAVLVQSVLPAGTHPVSWRPDGLAGGVYLMQLRTGRYTTVRPVVLLE